MRPALPADLCHPLTRGITEYGKPIRTHRFFGGRRQTKTLLFADIRAIADQGRNDYLCQVHAPLLFDVDKDIYGIDEEQAKLLAVNFVKSLLYDTRLVDDKGKSVNWESVGPD
jgi:hypothetical protein